MRSIEIVAHRVMADHFPENTIPALEEAIEHIADAVEFDVRLSSWDIPGMINHRYRFEKLGSGGE